MNNWEIYTDGSYSFSRDQGGVGLVIVQDGKEIQRFSKAYKHTTNNQMEVLAVLIGLLFVKNPIESLTIKTDSQYVIGCATMGWKRKKNKKLWAKYDELITDKQSLINTPIKFEWVKGHSDNIFNNICDNIAVAASKELIL